jgi:hypothetical protein
VPGAGHATEPKGPLSKWKRLCPPEKNPREMTSPASATGTSRAVWIALILLTAALVSTAAGFQAWAGGANVPTAILTGGAAFAGTVGLLLALAHIATGDHT